jgi:hypothetical protein
MKHREGQELMLSIFGLSPIHFLGILGLLALSRIFFGEFRGGGRYHKVYQRGMREHWEELPRSARGFAKVYRHSAALFLHQ